MSLIPIFEPGTYVRYNLTKEIGRVKSQDFNKVFVVFKCAGDWDNYSNYTGVGCKPFDLEEVPQDVIDNFLSS